MELKATRPGTVTQRTDRFGCHMELYVVEKNINSNYTKILVRLVHTTTNTASTWNGKVSERWIRLDQEYHYLPDYTQDNNPWVNEWCVVAEKEFTIYHDADGRKTINLWAHAYAPSSGYGPGHCYSTSVYEAWDVALDQLDRTGPNNLDFTAYPGVTDITVSGSSSDPCDQAHFYVNDVRNGISTAFGQVLTGLAPDTTYKVGMTARKLSNGVWGGPVNKWITTHPITVSNADLTLVNITPFSLGIVVTVDRPQHVARYVLHVRDEFGVNVIPDREIPANYTLEGLIPEKFYSIYVSVFTLRSNVETLTPVRSVLMPADSFTRIITTGGQLLGPAKLFVIDTNGIKTEVKKDMVEFL